MVQVPPGDFLAGHNRIFHNENTQPLEQSPQESGGFLNIEHFQDSAGEGAGPSRAFCQERLEQALGSLSPGIL